MMEPVKGTYRNSHDGLVGEGDFAFARNSQDKIVNIFYICPCGCKREGALTIDLVKDPNDKRQWKWNGSHRFPTLAPSIWSKKENGGCGFHGFLTDGVWTSC